MSELEIKVIWFITLLEWISLFIGFFLFVFLGQALLCRQASLELMISLTQSPMCYDHKHVPSHLALVI